MFSLKTTLVYIIHFPIFIPNIYNLNKEKIWELKIMNLIIKYRNYPQISNDGSPSLAVDF